MKQHPEYLQHSRSVSYPFTFFLLFPPYAVYVFKDDINNYPLLFRDLGRR